MRRLQWMTFGLARSHVAPVRHVIVGRLLAAVLALALPITVVPPPAVARHDDGYSPIVPWHHPRGATVTAGTPSVFGSRWGACTDRLARAARKGLDVTVIVDGEEVPPAGWSAPVRPTKRISPDKFRKQCLAKPDSPNGSWIFWRAPITFESPGMHRVGVTMAANRRVDDGAAAVLPRGWSISEEIIVNVVEPPAAGAFEQAGSLTLARTDHTATLLPDGRVLVTGGEGVDPEDLETAEVWDPATGTFGPAEALADAILEPAVEADADRTGHATTLLPDGRGLIIGGSTDDELLAEAELIDPGSGAVVPAGTLTDARTGHTATFLRDGRVLVVGGTGPDGPLASAEVWTSAIRPAKCLGKRPTLVAQPGVQLVGTAGNDVIAGSVGDDLISGGGGNDLVCGYGGADTIDGGGGNDRIDAGPGADMVTGGGGKDRLLGGRGADELDGGGGKDVCVGGNGIDWLPGCNEAKRTRGTVVVDRNLTLKGPHSGRFIIGKDGATLDCGGHTVTGPGRLAGLPGINLVRRKDVMIRNCDLRQFNDAFRIEQSHRNTFSDNRMSELRQGFTLQGSDKNKLLRNRVSDANDAHGIGIFDGSDKNQVRDNVVTGVYVFGFNLNTSKGNVFIGNVARGNYGPGFTAGEGAVGNTFSRNTAIDNAGRGFQDETTGFRGDAGTDNSYSDNTCSGNAGGDSSPATLCD